MVAMRSLTGAVLAAAVLALGLPLASASAQPGPGRVDYWGSYVGGGKADRQVVPRSMSLPGQVAEVGTSNSTDYALLTNGTLYAWGNGSRGELGDGGTADSFSAAVQVRFPAGVRIASIPTDVMPFDTALAVDTQGHVWGWGDNSAGQLCLGTSHHYLTPVELPFSDVTAVAGAGLHAVYDASGTLYSCGSGRYGELGDGSMQNARTPAQVRGLDGQSVTTVVASYADAGALLSDGRYLDWGLDSEGQLGNGTVDQSSDVPVQVPLPGGVTQVAQGGSFNNNGQTIVMLSDGLLFGWGDGHNYQLGNGQKGVFSSPVSFSAPNGVTYAKLATSGATSYAVSTAGVVYAWGAGLAGQVGNGNRATARKPVAVDSGATSVSATADDVAVNLDNTRSG